MSVAGVAWIGVGHGGVLQQEPGVVQGLSVKQEAPVRSGLQRKHCALKESKYVDFESFSLSVLF